MSIVRWEQRPQLRRPVMVAAFEGWNDAGDAATLAVRYLAETWNARRFATIDPEELFDFTSTRPTVRLIDGITRSIDWPANELWAASVPGAGRDVVLLQGVEPQLRWRTFCGAILEVAESLKTELGVTLGALLADVPHTRPVRVTGTAQDAELASSLGLESSRYEGPTGIVGVLHDAFTRGGIPSASLWASVPHYVHQVPSPKAALALVERASGLLGARVNPVELRVASEAYEREVSERVADDEDAAAYVSQLEEADDREQQSAAPRGPLPSADSLAAEVERFLRDHPRSD
jgi:predicted ATP-grasp superfamily ATP-dependent carboligase